MTTQTKYYNVVETAGLVREALKRNFPGIKFSVRSSTYAGGASIDVRWVLGPTTQKVDDIVGVYESRSFDGSIDMATNYNHWMTPDGKVTIRSSPGTEGSLGYLPKIDNPALEGAVPVSFGAHYIQTQRSLTADYKDEMKLREQVRRDMCALNHAEWNGPYNTVHLFGEGDTEQVDQHAWRLLNQTSFKPGEEYAGVRWMTEEERQERDESRTGMVIIKKGGDPAPEPMPHDVKAVGGITIRENKNLNGIELLFAERPSGQVLSQLKASGWHWNHRGSYWYNRMSEENQKFAESLTALAVQP